MRHLEHPYLESLMQDSIFFPALKSLLQYYFLAVKRGSCEEPTHLPVPGIHAAGLRFLSGLEKKTESMNIVFAT